MHRIIIFFPKKFDEQVNKVNISAIGIFGDCDGEISQTKEEAEKNPGGAGNKVEPIPTKDCVFSVDAIRAGSEKFVAGEIPLYDVLCIDDFDVKGKEWSNCTLITQGDLGMSLGLSVGVGAKKVGGFGSFGSLFVGLGALAGINVISVDVPWVIGLPLSQEQGAYKGLQFGGNILQDSGIGGVKAKKFVVATIARNGIADDISFLGTKPHNMELFFGITDHDKKQKCYSEVNLGKELDCEKVNSDFAKALKSGCLGCVLSNAHDPNPQNTIVAVPSGFPDPVVSSLKMKEILNDDASLRFASDITSELPAVMADIAFTVLVDKFEDIDLDEFIDALEDEIIKESDKIEIQLVRIIAANEPDFEDLTRIIELVDKLFMDIDSIVSDITDVEAKWDELKAVFGIP